MRKSVLTLAILALYGCGGGAVAPGAEVKAVPAQVTVKDANLRIVKNSAAPEVVCPRENAELWFVSGQSNASTSAQRPVSEPIGSVVQHFDGHCFIAVAPMLGATSATLEELPDRHNPFLSVAAEYSTRTGKTVVLHFLAIGGQSINRWANSGDLRAILSTELNQFAAIAPVSRILWQQGETDAINAMPAGEYVAIFESLVDAVRGQGFKGSIHVAQSSVCNDTPAVNPIAEAQQELQRRGYSGPNTDAIFGQGYRHDNCHFGAAGVKEFSRRWTDVLARGGA